jgi:hypothetical protein
MPRVLLIEAQKAARQIIEAGLAAVCVLESATSVESGLDDHVRLRTTSSCGTPFLRHRNMQIPSE